MAAREKAVLGSLPPLFLACAGNDGANGDAVAPPAIPPLQSPEAVAEAWQRACSRGNADVRALPALPTWPSMDADDKYDYLYAPALGIEGYTTPYTGKRVATLLRTHQKSVEHVLPKSFFKDPKHAVGPRDPNGWVVADHTANSARGAKPLTLWPRTNPSVALRHYRPPFDQRARLARKWLYMRYQYRDELDPAHLPSKPQRLKRALIFAWVRMNAPSEEEMEMNDAIHEKLGWSNPLLDPCADVRNAFLDSPAFRAAIFPDPVSM
jgi:hypothetical protein